MLNHMCSSSASTSKAFAAVVAPAPDDDDDDDDDDAVAGACLQARAGSAVQRRKTASTSWRCVSRVGAARRANAASSAALRNAGEVSCDRSASTREVESWGCAGSSSATREVRVVRVWRCCRWEEAESLRAEEYGRRSTYTREDVCTTITFRPAAPAPPAGSSGDDGDWCAGVRVGTTMLPTPTLNAAARDPSGTFHTSSSPRRRAWMHS